MASSLEAAASRPSSGVGERPPPRIPSRSRTQSISSDRPSTVAHSLMTPPLAVSPEPAFIAASAASQIVTNDYDSHAEAWYDQHGIEPPAEAATVSPTALQLVNSFLDQLLFNFLSVSRSTTLSALRPAVTEVLKPKLAKDAINQADEELREYLGDDGEDIAQPQTAEAVSPTGWDLELAWKRTRLRCMVYSSLGDMEEEDEDYYMEEGHLTSGPDDKLSESVSPAVAIFLTSILEFMGEQALIVAGQAAYHRIRAKYEKELKEGARSPTAVADRVVVEDLDMERVALDRTLGRLWRSWKKKIRSPAISSTDRLNRSYSKDSLHSLSGHLRSPGSAAEFAVPATVPEPDAEPGAPSTKEDPPGHHDQGANTSEPLEEHLVAAGVPLPQGPDDIAEIEVPGLALYRQERGEDDNGEKERAPARPKSMVVMPLREVPGQLSTAPSQHHAARRRSSTLPIPARPHFSIISMATRADMLAGLQDSPAEAGLSTRSVSQRAAEETEQAQTVETSRAENTDVASPGEEDIKDEIKDDDDDDDEVSIEEPRIVRSSRVSIMARTPSTTSPEPGKLASINTNLPIRTPSIHSARLIEVTSPRSPVVGSRRNSVALTEPTRHASPSSANRTITPPLSEDRQEQSAGNSAVGRPAINHSTKPSGLSSSVSASESGEPADRDSAVSPVTPVTPSAAHAGTGLPVVREPSTPPKPVIKNAVLPATSSPMSTASTTSGTFFIESMPVLPEGREAARPSQTSSRRYHSPSAPKPPAVPERNAGRQTAANTSALRHPAAVGQASAERIRDRSPSQRPSTSRSREPSAGRGRQQTSNDSSSTKLKTVQTEEQVQSRVDVARNFEELIQSDQTIQYTLTPESMRDLESQGQSVVSIKPRKSEEARRNGSRSRSSSVPRSDAKSSSSIPRSSGSGSHPVTDGHHSSRSFSFNPGKQNGVVPRSIPPVPSKPRAPSGPQARDARLERENLSEFAEFIRSTGPAGDRAANANGSPGSGRRHDHGPTSNGSIDTNSASATSNPNRPKLQPRGAVIDHKDDNSDLIDFIRRGPPSNAGNPRIPKSVAPFRSTMDSDQLSTAVGGRAVDAQLRDAELADGQVSNTTDSSVPPSVQSSVNSRSALVTKNKPVPSDAADPDMPIPKRKTRRVRDPYAIDLSDEEELEDDDEFTPLPPRRAQTQEESLIDFLNNYAPPPEPPVQPFNISQTRNAIRPKKKASTSSLMARLTRRDSSQSSTAGSTLSAASKNLEARSTSGRANTPKGGHIPIQVNIPETEDIHENPNGSSAKAAAMMGGGGPNPVRERVPMKKFEPREAISVPTRTMTDLAEFLKQSGPPAGMAPTANHFSDTVERDETSGISKVFSRRKKPSLSHPRRMPEAE